MSALIWIIVVSAVMSVVCYFIVEKAPYNMGAVLMLSLSLFIFIFTGLYALVFGIAGML